ncbi:hypothetical protein Nit79A3_2755 [Nitrosomonas sp. Is79A3]|uniref:hypothetical protein n=1 Tax=Nitrosomonas sp. (strain Is79A3) TaxID=261292 RepID=UPI000215D211
MNKAEIQDNHKVNAYLSEWKANHKLLEAGQLRRAKMHAARLIDTIDDKKNLTPALHQLLETSLVLETTDSKILAAYLQQSPAFIRTEFQKILSFLGKHQKNSKSFF